MERNSTSNNPFESSSDDDDSSASSKKVKKSFRAPLTSTQTDKPANYESSVEKADKPPVSLDTIFTDQKEHSTPKESTPETIEASESVMTPEETSEVTATIVHEHLAAMQEVDSETAEAIAPASEFLEKVEAGEDVDAAFRETAANLGMNQEEIDRVLIDRAVVAELGADSEPTPDVEQSHDLGEVFNPQTDSETEVDLTVARKSSASIPVASGGGGHGSGSGTGGTGFGSVPPSGGSSGSTGVGEASGPIFSHNQQPVPNASVNAMPTPAVEYYGQRRRAGELLLVGAIGYLIGRRRGRIKTERRLKPVRQRLEKQVRNLEENITLKEQQLIIAKARLNERVAQTGVGQTEAAKLSRIEAVKMPAERVQPSRVETRIDVQKPASAEQLGKMIVAAEAPKRVEQPSSIRRAFKAEEVPTMARNDLLELSEKILVEGASLRRIYESRLISEKQLRRLVGEYLQGNDISKDLRHEMVEHEIDFERDPILRDRVRSHLSSDDSKNGLGKLLKSVGVVDEGADPVMQKRIEAEEQLAAQRYVKKQRQRAAVDAAMVTVIVVLSVLVAILLFGL